MKHPIAEIFSQGEEVISGQVTDTNASWLSQQLVQMGFEISRHTAVGDKINDLVKLLQEISYRADLCICTGGLGPTIDDLTAEAVAQAFDAPLHLDSVALAQIEQYFSTRKKAMAESNRKQAYFPSNAVRIDNEHGSAPGFSIKQNKCWFIFLPGVPSEMKGMFKQHIQDQLSNNFTLQTDKLIIIKTMGIGESDLQQKLNNSSLPDHVQLGFRATTDEVQTKLLFPADMPEATINNSVNKVVALLGDFVFTVNDSRQEASLVSVINQLMIEKQYTLSILETASQGLIAAKCIGYEWLLDSSFKRISNEQENLADKANTIAHQLKQTQITDIILVQLYQQNTDNSIVLYNTLLTPQGTFQNTYTVSGSIHRKQNQAAIRALDLLRRFLQNKCH
jgi:competence/damage-inducible protein CinA-like protein